MFFCAYCVLLLHKVYSSLKTCKKISHWRGGNFALNLKEFITRNSDIFLVNPDQKSCLLTVFPQIEDYTSQEKLIWKHFWVICENLFKTTKGKGVLIISSNIRNFTYTSRLVINKSWFIQRHTFEKTVRTIPIFQSIPNAFY